MTHDELLLLLRDCYTPLGRGVVEAGLIHAASVTLDGEAPGFAPRFHAHIALRAVSSDESANAQLAAQIENRLLGVYAISRVTVELLPALFPIL